MKYDNMPLIKQLCNNSWDMPVISKDKAIALIEKAEGENTTESYRLLAMEDLSKD